MECNNLNNFYLALTDKEFLTLPLNFLLNGFRSRLDYQLVFGKMNPHSSVNLLKQVFKQWNTYLDKQTLGITKNLFGLLIKRTKSAKFVLHPMYLHVQKWTSVKLDLSHSSPALDQKSPERGNVANVLGKEVDFTRSLLDKQHEFNGISLEVNEIRQSFYLGRHAQQKFNKVVYKKLEK